MTGISHDRATLAASPDASPRKADIGPSWHEVARARRRPRRMFSLRARVLIYFTAVVLGSLGATAWIVTERSALMGRRMLVETARALGTSLANAAAPAIAGRDAASLKRLVDQTASEGQVLGVSITDPVGKAIATSTSAVGVRQPRDRLNRAADAVHASVPVIAGHGAHTTVLGNVDVALSDELIVQNREATLQAAGLVAIGVIVSALLLTWLYVRSTLRPLRQLTASAKRIAAGDLDVVIDVAADDVSGELAASFDELLSRTRRHREQIDAAHRATADAIADLEQKVEHRTAQLGAANERLSGEIAEKEDFLRAVSHDLNAPLRNIGGMVAMLLLKNKEQLPADALQRLERIQKNVDVETDLINELLELSRIKTRRQTLDVVDTESLVWDLRGMFENDLKTRHIDLVLETSLPSLYAERARLRQVFQNLIDNAIKYMGDGPVREIRVGCRVSVTEAEFYVRDTGMGIHPEDVEKVFFVFRRGRGEAALKVPGKGVGLSSVKSIVETYAGRIWVQSALGEGTTFRFTINGKYVPSVAGSVPSELAGQSVHSGPTLAAAAGSGNSGSRAA